MTIFSSDLTLEIQRNLNREVSPLSITGTLTL